MWFKLINIKVINLKLLISIINQIIIRSDKDKENSEEAIIIDILRNKINKFILKIIINI